MRRQGSQLCVGIVLCVFLSFSICLPLGHVCLNQFSGGTQLTQDSAWQTSKIQNSHKEDVCQACLLAQNLLLHQGAVELKVTRTPTSKLDRINDPIIAATDHFQSASNRAPPAGR
jgi:hypothetical protein